MRAPLPRLTSRQHPLVQRCRALARGRSRDGRILIDGEHALADAARAGVRIEAVLAGAGALTAGRVRDLLAGLSRAGTLVYDASPAAIDAASPVRTPSGLVAIATWTAAEPSAAFRPAPSLAIGLVGVQDPGNVGAVIRSADALGATGVLTDPATADPAGWKAVRGSMGGVFRVPVARASLAEALQAAADARALVIATIARGGTPLAALDLTGPVLALLGSEGAGLPERELPASAVRLTIPMREGVESLNVAVTAALILYEARQQREAGRP